MGNKSGIRAMSKVSKVSTRGENGKANAEQMQSSWGANVKPLIKITYKPSCKVCKASCQTFLFPRMI